MTLRIGTSDLTALLGDLVQTAAKEADMGAIHGVLLHTVREPAADEPGDLDLIGGASTTGTIAGHAWTTCAGDLGDDLMLIDRGDVDAVLAVLRPMAKKDGHAVSITRRDNADGDNGHGMLEVAEDPDLFGEAMSLRVPLRDPEDFPARGVYRLLETHQDGLVADRETGEVIEPERRTDFLAPRFAPFLAVAKRRNQPINLFRAHQAQPITLQIGPRYRGVLTTEGYPVGHGDAPSGEVHPPIFPADSLDADSDNVTAIHGETP